GGSLQVDQAIALSGNKLVLPGTSGTLTLTGKITGDASTSIVKNGRNTAVIKSDNSATFTGSTTINGRVLSVFAGSLGKGTSAITVKSGGALGTNAIDLGTLALNISGAGPAGAGAIENLTGDSHIAGAITISGPTTFGSDAGLLTIDSDIPGAANLL